MKTNKTKPIKKLLIFTIITVMIVSLFAVPTFAIVSVTWPQVDTSLIFAPVTITEFNNYSDYGSRSTSGMYALTFDNLMSDIQELDPSSNVNLFPDFTGVGYLEVKNASSVQYFVFGTGLRANGDDITVSVGYDMMHEEFAVFIDPHTNGASIPYFFGGSICTFYFTNYPPVDIAGASDTLYFWNDNANYSVGMVSSIPTDPDPEEPDNPTPPADGEEQGIFAVWSKITQWIVQGLASVSNAFYADGKLTLLGTLCIIPLALGLAFLLIGIIQKFLRLRG